MDRRGVTRRRPIVLLLSAGLLALPVRASGIRRPAPPRFELRHALRAATTWSATVTNQCVKYTYAGDATAPLEASPGYRSRLRLAHTVRDARGGAATIASRVVEDVNAMDPGALVGEVATFSIDRRGTILGADGIDGLDLSTLHARLPEGEVAVGDTWLASFQESPASARVTATATYRLVGIERVGGRPCARIAFHVQPARLRAGKAEKEEPAGPEAEGIAHVALDDGRVLRKDVNVEIHRETGAARDGSPTQIRYVVHVRYRVD